MTSCERYRRIAERMRKLIAAGQVTVGEPVSEEAIAEAEAELGYPLAPSLRWFLRDFGPAQFLAPPTSGEAIFGRPQVLAPGPSDAGCFLATVQALRQGKDGLPVVPDNLYPVVMQSYRDNLACADVYNYLDAEDADEEGEHRYCYFISHPFKPKDLWTFLDWLEGAARFAVEEIGAPPEYDVIAERLRSDVCHDRYAYGTPISGAEIAEVERALGFTFPEAYRRFAMEFRAASLGPWILPLTPEAKGSVLSVIREQSRARPRMPEYLIPFAQGVAWCEGGRFVPRYICFDRERSIGNAPCITDWAPKAAKRDRLKRTQQTVLGWLDERAQEPEKHLYPPMDWHNIPGWDHYWTLVIANDFQRKWEAYNPGFSLRNMIGWLRERGYRRILFAGNGISLEPYAFAHLGFDVTALDLSPVASKFVGTFPIAPEHLTRFLPACVLKWDRYMKADLNTFDEAESLKRVEREYVPGGSVQVVTADMFSYAPDALFDVVYSRRSFQGFAHPERVDLARMLARCVRPGGACVVETMNVTEEGCRAMDDEFHSAGFFVRGIETTGWYDEATRPGFTYIARKRRADAERKTHAVAETLREAVRLGEGEKLVIFCHGSG